MELREYTEIPMNVNTFLQEVNDKLRGTDDDAPVIGTDEASYWLRTMNRIRRKYYKTAAKNQLKSTYSVLELGTITAAAEPSFDLDDNFVSAASDPYVIDAEGGLHPFDLIQPQERDSSLQQVFIAGQDPQILYFSNEITDTETWIGGSLFLPAYSIPDDISTSSGTATVVIEDSDWLVVATAAELAGNDIVYEDRAENLNNEANGLYKDMLATSKRGVYGSQRKMQRSVKRIGLRA